MSIVAYLYQKELKEIVHLEVANQINETGLTIFSIAREVG